MQILTLSPFKTSQCIKYCRTASLRLGLHEPVRRRIRGERWIIPNKRGGDTLGGLGPTRGDDSRQILPLRCLMRPNNIGWTKQDGRTRKLELFGAPLHWSYSDKPVAMYISPIDSRRNSEVCLNAASLLSVNQCWRTWIPWEPVSIALTTNHRNERKSEPQQDVITRMKLSIQ